MLKKCDLVKYTDVRPTLDDWQTALNQASDFVDRTKPGPAP
jgi:hypothetical protein